MSHRPTRWFITAGSGLVDSALLRRLATDAHEVFAPSRSDQAVATVSALGAHPVRGDLDDLASDDATRDGAEAVVHLAAETVPHRPGTPPLTQPEIALAFLEIIEDDSHIRQALRPTDPRPQAPTPA